MTAKPKSQPTATNVRSNSKAVPANRAARAKAAPPVASSIFEGLPSPEELAKYEQIVPGGAERLIELAEQRAAHREATERRALEAEIKASQVRTVIGFTLALSVGVLGGMLLLQGSELAGLILILLDAVALVAVTLYGHRASED